MYKLLLPNRKIVEINRVEAFVEKQIVFAGKTCWLTKLADQNDNATMLKFSTEANFSRFNGVGARELVVGNLKTEEITEILEALLKDGYYDFSKLEYQDAKKYGDIIMDEGVSLPYLLYNNVERFLGFFEDGRVLIQEVNNKRELPNFVLSASPFSFRNSFDNMDEDECDMMRCNNTDFDEDGMEGYDVNESEGDEEEYDPDNLQ